VRKGDNLHVPIVLTSGSLNLLEPSGPVQACNGIVLSFYIFLKCQCASLKFYFCHFFHTILPVVLYGCEIWSLTLREERRLRVFENRVMRRVFGPKRDEVTGEWRKLYNEELNDLYSLPNIVRVEKSRRMRWAGHVARMGEDRVCTGCWWGSLRERGHWGDQDVDGRIILRWIFRKLEGSWGRDGVGSGQGQVAGTCGYGEGLLGSINVGNFLTSCKVYWLASQEGLCSME